jgi:hypothetical protein
MRRSRYVGCGVVFDGSSAQVVLVTPRPDSRSGDVKRSTFECHHDRPASEYVGLGCVGFRW